MAFDPEDEDEQRRREAMTTVNRRKLLEHQKVEVRSCTDEGFLGSWHSGTVIATESSARWVQYDHLLLDEYSSTKLVERIEVPSIVDGIEINNKSMSNYRGWIRPLSPPCYFSIWFLHYGQCVDVYYSDAWWEGVILDHQDGSAERNVFFPDIGDEMAAHKDNLRISQDWDEQTELWKPRGNWIFLELIEEIEKDWPILVSVKQIWYDVRARSGFDNLKEWTSCLTDIWRELLLEVIVDNIKLFLKDFFPTLSSSSSGNTLHDCGHLMELSGPILDAVLKNKECFVDSLAVVPGSNGFLNRSEFLHVDEKGEYRQPCDEINRDKLATVTTFDRLGKMPLSSSVKTIDEEIACASSRTMAIAPSMTGEVSKVNSCTNHEESFNASLEVSKITKNNVWHPAGPNIVSDPDYCPEAVDEYCRLFKSGNKRYLKVQNNVWKHLLFMGWKIEYRNNERINGMQQLRYIEPGSPEKYFVSLVDVCEYLKAGASKELCSFTDLKIPKEKAQDNWVPFCLPEPEFYEDAVTEYINISKCGRQPSEEHILNVLKHLSFLGWKVEYTKETWRYRFIMPKDGGSEKEFRSLFEVCQYMETSSSDIVSMFPQDVQNCLSYAADATLFPTEHSQERKSVLIGPSPDEELIFEPEYCPQAVMNYHTHVTKEKGDHSKWKTGSMLKDMQLKVKKHLFAVGWKLYHYRTKKKLRYRYISPSRKMYDSLRSACKGYIDEEIHVGKLAEVQLPREARYSPSASEEVRKEIHCENKKKRKSSSLHLASLSSNSVTKENKSKKIQAIKSKDNINRPVSVSDRVLRSSKRAREVVDASSSHRNPCTILSWLMDNQVVLPSEKVQYRIGKDCKMMAEGRVTRDGIKCNCCQETFTLHNFEVHANSTCHQPSANIFLENGRSLLECQLQLRRDLNTRGSNRGRLEVKGKPNDNKTDSICSVCHSGGNLLLCDGCPSTFHTRCLGLKGVPTGNWFCPSCCCKICGQSKNSGNIEVFTNSSVINCDQCARQYHISCLRMKGHVLESYPKKYWFCNFKCKQISVGLQTLLGKPVQLGRDHMTWTLLKYIKPDKHYHNQSDIVDSTEIYSKLNIALGVMHECFEPLNEPRTRRDLVEDVIFNRRSKLQRLNFHGFYTVLLEKNDELITTAILRVHGEKVAEIPLVATRSHYRRRGMCHVLMDELEKVLVKLGVERLVLPAIPSMLNTWISSFGFSRMSPSERLELLDYTFLSFKGTTMCQKLLLMTPRIKSNPPSLVKQHSDVISGDDIEGSSGGSEILQTERVDDNGAVGQTCINLGGGVGGEDKSCSDYWVSQPTGFEYVPCQNGEMGLQSSGKGSD
ncbi:uncharacterized protein LOC108207694 [Daucus carota subsp. sativus]|uniref:uncharacterized protein LOC108207694 n=1 Tax=Daucus carota subsp. sativus TaxID=79200 RepID=UPI0007B184AE|nr:PREDICTED: uncharacterized protein LOC108207694 [Daucus carota subsp. sativus]